MTIQDNNGESLATVPYFVHEMEMTRLEIITKRLTHTVVIEAILFITFLLISCLGQQDSNID